MKKPITYKKLREQTKPSANQQEQLPTKAKSATEKLKAKKKKIQGTGELREGKNPLLPIQICDSEDDGEEKETFSAKNSVVHSQPHL